MSVWDASKPFTGSSSNDGSAVEVGVKFRVASAGTISGVKFYKISGNSGTHTGSLWSASGQRLATGTFANETASGWQQLLFAAPVAVTANTTYVASYHAPAGNYARSTGFFASALTAGEITLMSDGQAGGNGVYRYGASGFPSGSYNASNY